MVPSGTKGSGPVRDQGLLTTNENFVAEQDGDGGADDEGAGNSTESNSRLDTPQDRADLHRRPLTTASRRNAASIERPCDGTV